jgi:hypothetical protein
MKIAIVDDPAARADFHNSLLLAFGAVQVVAVAEKLQVREAGERSHHPDRTNTGYQQQSDAGTAPIHWAS